MKKEEFMTITNKDIYELIKSVEKVTLENNEHAKYTNGKIAEAMVQIQSLKSRSIGMWIANHPFRFAGIVMVFFAFVISDIRHPMLELIKNLFI